MCGHWLRHFGINDLFFLVLFSIFLLTIPSHWIMAAAAAAANPFLHDKRLYSIGREEYDTFAEHFLLPEDFDLAIKTPTKRPSADELDAILNNELFEGDILGVDPEGPPKFGDTFDQLAIRQHDVPITVDDEIFAKPYYSSLNTQTYADKLWRQGRVPYMLEEGMTPSQRAAIASAFDEYKGKTCIRFVPKEQDDQDHIFIKRNHALGCSSYVGRAGGNQTVSLEVDKCFSKGIIAHELMHALGFFHEHSRTDRDEFVDIQEENVRPGMLRNFEKYPRKIIDPLGMPYDYDSVMHYHKLAFSRNGRPTITPKKRDAEIGQRYKLSVIDAKKVNTLYHCNDDQQSTSTIASTTSTTMATTTEASETTEEEEEEQTTSSTSILTTTDQEMTSSPYVPSSSSSTDNGEEGQSSTSPTIESTTTTEEEENGQGETTTTIKSTTDDLEEEEERKIRAGMRRRGGEKEKPGGGGVEGWPRKFITLSIWSTRGGGGNGMGRKVPSSKGDGKGLKRIKENRSRRVEKECLDLNAHCEMWERLGHCVHSVKYMRHYCRKSCGLCDKDERTDQENSRLNCSDRNHFCSYWARNGECDNGSRFMKLFCKRSCGLC